MVTRGTPRRHRNRPVGESEPQGDRPLAATSGLPLFPNPAGVVDADGPAERSPMLGQPPAPVPSQPPLSRSQDSGLQESLDTPAVAERVAATTPAASISSRLVAGTIDVTLLLVLDALVVGLTLRLAGLGVASLEVLPAAPLAAFLLLLDGGYLVVLTATGGQTFGKMVAGIRVVDTGGRSVSSAAALIRATTMVLSLLAAGAGLIWICTVRDRRGVHDRIAGTLVVVVHRSA
jgi:uncharacterized RDD family membrane protein YckC